MVLGLVHVVSSEEGCSGELSIDRDFRAILGFAEAVIAEERRSWDLESA